MRPLFIATAVAVGLLSGPCIAFAAPRTVAAGSSHTCVLDGGSVSCWGANTSGQLGDGTFTDRVSPRRVRLPGVAVEVAAGGDMSCARLESGRVYCWGAFATLSRAQVPGRMTEFDGAVQLAIGTYVACARFATGRLRCVDGSDDSGDTLADLDMQEYMELRALCAEVSPDVRESMPECPRPSPTPNVVDATDLRCADDCCATRANGSNVCWGSMQMTCHPLSGGRLVCSESGPERDGGRLASFLDANVSTYGQADGFDCALVEGAAYCWGYDFGLAGTRIAFERPATELSVGDAHACARLDDGAVVCIGRNTRGARGERTSTPTGARVVPGVSGATSIAVGRRHACASVTGGEVLCWGDDSWHQLGRMPSDARADILTQRGPRAVTGITDARSVFAHREETCAVTADDTIACWGRTAAPDASSSAITISRIPTPGPVRWWTSSPDVLDAWFAGTTRGAFRVGAPSDAQSVSARGLSLSAAVDAYAIGAAFGCSLSAGVVRCGVDGSVAVSGIDAPTELVGRGGLVCARDGAGAACVRNDRTLTAARFERVAGTRGIRGLVAYQERACGVMPTVGVACWSHREPVSIVPGTARAVAVALGASACAILDDGRVACFGDNAMGVVAPDDAYERTPNRITLPTR